MGFPYSWVNTRCANDGRIYTIPIPMAGTMVTTLSVFNNVGLKLKSGGFWRC